MKALRWLIIAVVAIVAWFSASRKRHDDLAMGYEIQKRRAGIDNPEMDEDFARDVTPADPVQAFRNGGAV